MSASRQALCLARMLQLVKIQMETTYAIVELGFKESSVEQVDDRRTKTYCQAWIPAGTLFDLPKDYMNISRRFKVQ